MQKIKIKIKILICTALILLSGGMLFSCDARVKNVCAYDVIELSYGSPLDLNNLVLKVEYSNGRIKTFKYSDIKKEIMLELFYILFLVVITAIGTCENLNCTLKRVHLEFLLWHSRLRIQPQQPGLLQKQGFNPCLGTMG